MKLRRIRVNKDQYSIFSIRFTIAFIDIVNLIFVRALIQHISFLLDIEIVYHYISLGTFIIGNNINVFYVILY